MGLKNRRRLGSKASGTRETAAVAQEKSKSLDAANDDYMSPKTALDRMHWMRQAAGILTGAAMGALQVKGSAGFATFVAVTILAPNAFFSSVLNVDEDAVARVGSLQTEGIMSAFALFLLAWILLYTTFM